MIRGKALRVPTSRSKQCTSKSSGTFGVLPDFCGDPSPFFAVEQKRLQ